MTGSQDAFSSSSSQPHVSVDHFATNSSNGFESGGASSSHWALDSAEAPSGGFRDLKSEASVTGDGHRGIKQLLRGMGAETADDGFDSMDMALGTVADYAPSGDAEDSWMRFQTSADSSAATRFAGNAIGSTFTDDSLQGTGRRTGLVNFDDMGSATYEGSRHTTGVERSGGDALDSTDLELQFEPVLPGSRGRAFGNVDLSEQSDQSSISRVVLPALAASLFSQPRKVRDAEVHCRLNLGETRLEESSLNCSSSMPRPWAPTSPQASCQVKDWGGQTVLEDGQKPRSRNSESSSPGSHCSGKSCHLPPMTRPGANGKVPASPGRPRRLAAPVGSADTAGPAKPPWRAGTSTPRRSEGGARLKPTGQAMEAARRMAKG